MGRRFTTQVSPVQSALQLPWFPVMTSLTEAPPTADPPPYIDGIRINSPHYLTKMKLTSGGTHTFTLVVSQYEKQNTINYTLRVRTSSNQSAGRPPSDQRVAL